MNHGSELYSIYFTMIDKQALQLILIFFVGTDVSARGSMMWEKARVPGENPRVQAGNLQQIHATNVDHGD